MEDHFGLARASQAKQPRAGPRLVAAIRVSGTRPVNYAVAYIYLFSSMVQVLRLEFVNSESCSDTTGLRND